MMTLRPYQSKAVDGLRGLFSQGFHRLLLVLPCGAGKTVIFSHIARQHLKKDPSNRVLVLEHRRELIEQTEDTFGRFSVELPRTHIAMVLTLANHLEEEPTPSLIICDEAHHAASKTYRRIFDHFKKVPVIGMTATPARLDGKPLGDLFDSMFIGDSAASLISQGYLAKYDYFAPKINLPDAQFKMKGSDYDPTDAFLKLDKAGIYGDLLKHFDPACQTIIYAPTVEMSRRIAAEINSVHPGMAAHFDGDTPKEEREKIVDAYRKGEIRALCNCDIISEGFDIPACDCVMMTRPTKSTTLFIQQSMRCLRPKEGKKAIIFDFVGNVWRHGMPTDEREWSLKKSIRCLNPSSEPEVIARECSNCLLAYSGRGRLCPFCGHDNGKTRVEIEEDRKAELLQVKEVKRKQQGRARTMEELIQIGEARHYSNPRVWAWYILKYRNGKI